MKILLAGSCFAMLSACMAPQIEAGRYVVDYNRAVEIEANETTLLNIVRARHRAPTHYTSTQSIAAQLTATREANIGITPAEGAITRSVDAAGNLSSGNVESSIGGSAGYKLTYSQEPTFSIAVLNTPDFARGTSSPIDEATFQNFLAEGYRSQILIALMVDSMLVVDRRVASGPNSLLIRNPNGERDPQDCGEVTFETLRDNLDLRLSTRARERPLIGTLDPRNPAPAIMDNLADLLGSGAVLSANPAGMVELRGPLPASAVSLSANQAELTGTERNAIFSCATRGLSQGEYDAEFLASGIQVGDLTLFLAFRSPDGVVYGMGEYMRNLNECGAASPCSPVLIGDDRDALFNISEISLDDDPGDAVVHTEYLSHRYVVPAGTNHRTMQVINIIQKLINLNKSADELRTPAFIQVD